MDKINENQKIYQLEFNNACYFCTCLCTGVNAWLCLTTFLPWVMSSEASVAALHPSSKYFSRMKADNSFPCSREMLQTPKRYKKFIFSISMSLPWTVRGALTQSSSNISVPLWNKVVKGLDLLLFLIVLMKIHQPRLLVGPCHKEQNNINFHIYHYLAITRGKSISYLLQVC